MLFDAEEIVVWKTLIVPVKKPKGGGTQKHEQ